MSQTAFDLAYERTVSHEGGFSDDHRDAGNWTGGVCGRGELKGTKYGISAAEFPDEDIRNLTPERAKELAKTRYWDAMNCKRYRFAVAIQFFDAGYNHGQPNAIRFLQRAARVADDGVFGPITQGALEKMDENDVLFRFLAARLEFMTKISTWSTYGKGWARRVAQNLNYAAEDNDR